MSGRDGIDLRLNFALQLTGPFQVWGCDSMDLDKRCPVEISHFRRRSGARELGRLLAAVGAPIRRTGLA